MTQFEGVLTTEVGYANGDLTDPTYQQVYTDQTGHVECVKVMYDSEIVALATICRLFFRSIDPLLVNRQGEDVGTRYRTGIYWEDETDREVIGQIFDEVRQSYNSPLAVEMSPMKCFYPAEDYHQDYLVKNPDGYCHLSLSVLKFAKQYSNISRELRKYSDEEKKIVLPRFFKTGKGEYAEGDKFIGVVVPNTRRVATLYKEVSYEVLEALLESEWHELRLCALLILVQKYKESPHQSVQFYLSHTKGINNWDLTDLSAPYILGTYLLDCEDRSVLHELAQSANMWEQRIAVVSTLMLIRHGIFSDTIRLAEMFMDTRHDLMQKSVGWMLREIGKRDESLLTEFLEKHKHHMPRTMLRYAIEKYPPEKRQYFMGRIEARS